MRESNFGAVVIIGGNGIQEYWGNTNLHNLVQKFDKSNKVIGAICSAPIILARAGLLNGKEATCYPDNQKHLERDGAVYVNKSVVFRKNIITAQDPSSAHDFALTLTERLN